MVDPNRKININLPSTDEESSSGEEYLGEEHVKMVKEFEEEFKDRFTEKDEEFMKFSRQKTKPPIIVYPFDNYFRHNNHRGFNRRPRHGGHDNHNQYPRFSGSKYNHNDFKPYRKY